jgi:hypothetical protein
MGGGFDWVERTMRFLLRLASLVSLVVATIAGTIDSIQSVAASTVVITPIGDAWQDVSPATLDKLQSALSFYIHPRLSTEGMGWILSQPTFAVFLVISLLLWMLAYRKPQPAGRFNAGRG